MSAGRVFISMTLLILLGLAPSAQAQDGSTSIFLSLEERVSELIEEALGAWEQLFNLANRQNGLQAQPSLDLSSTPASESSTAGASEAFAEAESADGTPPASEIHGAPDPWGAPWAEANGLPDPWGAASSEANGLPIPDPWG